jgi:hypothetical protein
MYWPRLRLTKKEAERWAPYYEPDKKQRAVLYRAYGGVLNFNTVNLEDIENVQISRRARVFAMTVSGDVHNTEVEIYDSGGEQYTMGPIPLMNMFPGLSSDPRGAGSFNPALDTLFLTRRLTMGAVYGHFFNTAPHVFEPTIVLEPNQTLTVRGRNMCTIQDSSEGDLPTSHVSFCFHVWEFPIE